MTSISQCFESLRASNRCALIPFVMAGDPDLQTTAKTLQILDSNGADLIELGLPYSDPLADGPVIQAAATRALKQGICYSQVLAMVRAVTPSLRSPLVLFSYYNLILNRGFETFFAEIANAGVRGLVVPDLPVEEASQLIETATAFGIEVILLVALTSSFERIEAIARQSQGFIYLVSSIGVTGMRSHVNDRVKELLNQLRSVTDKPIGVGFGISDSQQARQVMDWGADAVIVGSAFVKRLATGNSIEGLQFVEEFCQQLKAALLKSDINLHLAPAADSLKPVATKI